MRLIVSVLMLLLAVVLAVQNTEVVDVSLLFWHLRASLAIVIALCLVLGMLFGLAVVAPLIFRERRSTRKLETRLADIEAERNQSASHPPESSLHTSAGPEPAEPRTGKSVPVGRWQR